MSREISEPYAFLCNLCNIDCIVYTSSIWHHFMSFKVCNTKEHIRHTRIVLDMNLFKKETCGSNVVFGYKYFMKITCMWAYKRPHSGKQVIHMTAQALIGTNILIHRSVYLVRGSNVADSFVVFYPFCVFFYRILFIYSADCIVTYRIALRRLCFLNL